MKRPFVSCRRGLVRAFTIIELVVAIGVTALMVTLMLTITLNMLNGWNRSSGVLNTGNQARYILDQLTLDLQNAVLFRSTDAVFVATIQGSQDVNGGDGDADTSLADWPSTGIKPEFDAADPNDSLLLNATAAEDRDIRNYRFGQAGVWLRFLANVSDNVNSNLDNLSAPRAVAYQIVRRRRVNDTDSPYSYQLFRSEVSPDLTFQTGYDLLGDNDYYNKTATSNADEHPIRIRRPGLESLIGDGVIDFGVRIFAYATDTRDLDGDGDVSESIPYEVFPVDRRINDGDSSIRYSFVSYTPTTLPPDKTPAFSTFSGNPSSAQTSYAYPAVVEVMIRVLTPQGLQTIQAFEQDASRFGGYSTAKWWELAIQNSNVYTRRIAIPAALSN